MRSFRPFVALLPLMIAVQASACSGGQQWLRDVGPYTIDITDDTPEIEPGQPVHFDFGLTRKSDDTSGESVAAPFTTVQVALMDGEEMLLSKNLDAQEDRELTGFDYVFPDKHAKYVLVARYMDGTHELAATSIPLTVGKGDRSLSGGIAGMLFTATAVAGGFFLIVYRKHLRPTSSPRRRRS